MNFKIILSFIILSVFLTVSTYGDVIHPNNQKNFYTKILVGASFYEKFKPKCEECVYAGKPSNNFSGSLALGYNFNKNISAEILGHLTYLRWRHDFAGSTTSQKMKSYSLFANIYFKHPKYIKSIKKELTPYLMLGPGYTINRSSTIFDIHPGGFDDSNFCGRKINSLAWNIGGGVMLILNKNHLLDINYRYISLGKIGFYRVYLPEIPETKKIKAHNISLGMVFKF